MSYDIALTDTVTGKVLELESARHMRGGTYQVGGSTEASLNVTYNYSPMFTIAFGDGKGVRSIYGLTGAASLPVLKSAISNLGSDVDPDY